MSGHGWGCSDCSFKAFFPITRLGKSFMLSNGAQSQEHLSAPKSDNMTIDEAEDSVGCLRPVIK
jgi:hypothetical protein